MLARWFWPVEADTPTNLVVIPGPHPPRIRLDDGKDDFEECGRQLIGRGRRSRGGRCGLGGGGGGAPNRRRCG